MRTLTILAALVSAVIATGIFSEPTSADSIFAPTSGVRLCNTLPVPFTDASLQGNPACADVLTQSAPTDTSFQVSLQGPSLSFATNVIFMAGSTITAGGSIPAGTKLGGVRETLTHSITNGQCSSV